MIGQLHGPATLLLTVGFGLLGSVAMAAEPSAAPNGTLMIASVPPEYRPTAGAEAPEPVTMQRFHFEVQPQTGRARVVVDYTYPDKAAFGSDGGIGPAPSAIQLAGLKYAANEKAIVFEDHGHQTVCATVRDHRSLFRTGLTVTPTGACTVTAKLTAHTQDTGWAVQRRQMLDTFFVVQ